MMFLGRANARDTKWMLYFHVAQTGKHLLRAQNVSEQNQKHFLCPGRKICVRNKCCARRQTGKHLCQQQYILVCQGLRCWTHSVKMMFDPKYSKSALNAWMYDYHCYAVSFLFYEMTVHAFCIIIQHDNSYDWEITGKRLSAAYYGRLPLCQN